MASAVFGVLIVTMPVVLLIGIVGAILFGRDDK